MAFGYSLSMRVTVLFFGVLKEILSSESQTLDLPPGATVDAVLRHFRELFPQQPKLWSTLAIAVNQSYAPSGCLLRDGDEVALLPPVSGGSGPVIAPVIALVTEPIDSASLVRDIKQGEDGAVVVFDGIVRNHTRGRRTLCLVYEAYQEMALRQMQALAQEAIATHRAIYVNDNFGQWRSDFRSVVKHCTDPSSRGAPIAKLLRPQEVTTSCSSPFIPDSTRPRSTSCSNIFTSIRSS